MYIQYVVNKIKCIAKQGDLMTLIAMTQQMSHCDIRNKNT